MEIRTMRKQLVEKDEVIDILKNPSASCRNHSEEISLRSDVTPPWNHCGAGVPGLGDLTQRLLWLSKSQSLWEGAEQPGAWTQTGSTTPKISCPGTGQPLPSVETGVWIFLQACPPADAACRECLSEMSGLQNYHKLPAQPPYCI